MSVGLRAVFFIVLILPCLGLVGYGQPINDECVNHLPLVKSPSTSNQKINLHNAAYSNADLYYTYSHYFTQGKMYYNNFMRAIDVWFLTQNDYDNYVATVLAIGPGATYANFNLYENDCDSLTPLEVAGGIVSKKFSDYLVRISINKFSSIDSVRLRFFYFNYTSKKYTKDNVSGDITSSTLWLNNAQPRAGDSIYLNSNAKIQFLGLNDTYRLSLLRVGREDTESKSSFSVGKKGMLGMAGNITINHSDTLRFKRRSALLVQLGLNNLGFITPYDLQSDSIRLYFRGRGTGRVLTGKDPFLLLRQPLTGGGTRPVGSMELNVTGKLMWPWATSEFEEFVLCRGIMAMPAGSAVATNKFIRVGGELHSPIQPISWANRPFTLVYPKGNDYGVWGADIDWRQTQEFRTYLQNPSTQVVLDNFQPDREGESSNFVTLAEFGGFDQERIDFKAGAAWIEAAGWIKIGFGQQWA